MMSRDDRAQDNYAIAVNRLRFEVTTIAYLLVLYLGVDCSINREYCKATSNFKEATTIQGITPFPPDSVAS